RERSRRLHLQRFSRVRLSRPRDDLEARLDSEDAAALLAFHLPRHHLWPRALHREVQVAAGGEGDGREMEKVDRLYVPPLPTLWPSMLAGRRDSRGFLPFDAPTARYFYFARNAVWLTVKMLGLDGGEVLVPAYHH